ncbi:signal recognition particle [Methylacidiphilum kamchatkense Kam1]|uniref:signal-recognition-particle GTPase n=1 Tax=Methylacidiphilum kamchatkense Kam1 TaxID=1202785 RepID=A0A0C1UPP1_9BACT|nr:signal recognition particle protein [Methylacidiphilum kamchatkense]KIE57763.1 signal recognition particle [Methylacidiphilum kamchatkense Kam1]QDQ42492.1 signal recognition particle subunit FFH/SRP54 (srp54) [Methylacidiphilum kamchatkense Kam1]
MLELLQQKLQSLFKNLRGYGKLSEENISGAIREIRLALLAADVHYQVVRDICEEVKQKALGTKVLESIRPGDQFIKIFHDALIEYLASEKQGLSTERPLRILLCGLNGSGKTTTAAKLALWCKKNKERVGLVAADLTRPAAREQLTKLASQIDVPVYAPEKEEKIEAFLSRALEQTKQDRLSVVIYDTAGRLDLDEELLKELQLAYSVVLPQEVLLVIDSATGQKGVDIVKAFLEKIPVSGLILSKFDGDARGGAAFSVKKVTGLSVLFLGTGEKVEAFEPFRAERLVDRLFGFGDIVSFVEKVEAQIKEESLAEIEKKIRSKQFGLDDFLVQMRMLKKLGPLDQLLSYLPGFPGKGQIEIDDKKLKRIEAIVLSMTPEERKNPDIINGKRKLRIAKGSGTTVPEINEFLRRFDSVRKLIKKFSASKEGFKFPFFKN